MSQNFEPPGSTRSKRVEIIVPLVNGDQMQWDGEFASSKLTQLETLVATGGLEGWQIINELLGDDWGAQPRAVQFFVDGKKIVSIPYDKPKRRG